MNEIMIMNISIYYVCVPSTMALGSFLCLEPELIRSSRTSVLSVHSLHVGVTK